MTQGQTAETSAKPRKLAALWYQPAVRLWLLTLALTLCALLCTGWLYSVFRAEPFSQLIFARLLFIEDAFALQIMLLSVVLSGLAFRLNGQALLVHAADAFARKPATASLGVTVVFALMALVAYQRHPLAMDEYAVLFQAQVFASGHITAQWPVHLLAVLIPPGFQNYFLLTNHVTGAVASAYWPGFALIMAPFAWLGAPWLVNPVLSGLTIWVTVKLGKTLFGEDRLAGLTALFLLACPVFWASGIGFYSMTATLLFNMLFAWGLWLRTGRAALLAGLAGGVALCMHNPVPHLLFAAPWLVWLLFSVRRGRLIVAALAGYALPALLLGMGWSLFRLAHFSESIGGAAHTAATHPGLLTYISGLFGGLRLPDIGLLRARLGALCKMWAWAWPGLLVLAAWGYRTASLPLRLFAGSLLVTFLGYMFVPFDQGHGWGYRYIHYAWIAFPLLAAHALRADISGVGETRRVRIVTALVLTSLLIAIPLRMWQIHAFIANDLAQLPVIPAAATKTITFIRPNVGFYTIDLVQNDADLHSNHVRMLSSGDQNDARLIQALYPGSHIVAATAAAATWQIPGQ